MGTNIDVKTKKTMAGNASGVELGEKSHTCCRDVLKPDCKKAKLMCNQDADTRHKLEELHDIIYAAAMGTWHIELVEGQEPRMQADTRMMELMGLDDSQMTPEEIYHEWFSRIEPDSVQSVLDSVARMERCNGTRDENTYLWQHPTLGLRYVRCGGTAREVPGGYILRGYHYDVDDIVRENMRQQEQLAQALAVAEQSSRAKTVFLNSMSHDIRTPMNAIIGFTALAQTHIDNKDLVQEYLAKISTSGSHLLSLINDILDMSRIESGSVKLEEKPVHIPDLLHDLRNMLQGIINSRQQNLYIDTQDVQNEDVITDKLRLNQILLNICSNAIKFTPIGGDIIIHLVEKPCNKPDYTTYEFSIKDNGIGMSKEFLTHIFDTFSREYSATVSGIQGTGLGMSITKNIVDMMGGTIEVESQEGIGSRFTVTLDLRMAKKHVEYAIIPELQGARALVIDDDIDTCRSVCKMLRNIGMRPDWTASGKEAILRAQDARELKDEYGVYIVDYLMPDMNGVETVRQIRRAVGEDVPIIILTAYDWADFEAEARAAGVTAFVAKPIFMSELRAVLTRPVEDGEMQQRENTAPMGISRDYRGRRALLVEDNELNREIATALLESTGMEIDSVGDGIEAVNAIAEAPEDRYDIVFMDIQMPSMDGYTATREIRTLANNRKANIPIVAMTANAFEEDRQKAFESGMNGHIVKPLDMGTIVHVLDGIFEDEDI